MSGPSWTLTYSHSSSLLLYFLEGLFLLLFGDLVLLFLLLCLVFVLVLVFLFYEFFLC